MSRHSKHMTPIDNDDEFFGADDLDIADQIAGALPGAASGLGQKVALRDQKWQELARVAPFARVNPVSVLKGVLGGQQDVMAGQQIQVANWAGDDAETLPITVTLARVQRTPIVVATGPGDIQPFGIVQFGTRGFLVRAEVDICFGCQFTVSGSAATLSLAMPTNTDGSLPVLRLAGMLSFHPIIRTAPLTRTFFIASLAAGATAFIPIPNFAKTLKEWRFPTTEGFTVNVAFAGQRVIVAAGALMDAPIIISNAILFDQTGIDITNNGAVAITISAIFELAI